MAALRRRELAPPRRTTGLERRWLDPRRGLFKLTERTLDRFFSRHVYPHVLGVWHPYCWLLPRTFGVAEASVTPPLWPTDLAPLTILVVSDVHTGAFLKPEVLEPIFDSLMALEPDLVAIAGDVVEGAVEDLDGFTSVLARFAAAPLGAWYCFGNHDYYTGEAERIREILASVGISTLRNRTVEIVHRERRLRLGGIDDRIMGEPDWTALAADHGPPHVLLAHNPDDFYEAARLGVALVLSGHTHGGQIRLPNGPPLVRQSQFCLDEGLYAHDRTLLAVTRGVGAVALPWRAGAHPEALLLRVGPPVS